MTGVDKGTRVTATNVADPNEHGSTVIVDDYVLITDGSAQLVNIQTHSNGTHVITVRGVRRKADR